MTVFLHALSYVTALAAFLFVVLSLASGLLWLSEVIEEHSRTAKTFGSRFVYAIIFIHALLYLVDSFPLSYLLFSIFCHLVYLVPISASSWPFISLTSPAFIGSCILVVSDHFLWFYYFSQRAQDARRRRPPYGYANGYGSEAQMLGFMEVATFFAICVWFVPLFLFLSLSAGDNMLPTAYGDASSPSTPTTATTFDFTHCTPVPAPAARTSLFKQFVDPIVALIPFRRGQKSSDEGIIAPRTPTRSPQLLPATLSRDSSIDPGWSLDASGSQLAAPPRNPGSIRSSPTTPLPPPTRRVTSDGALSQGARGGEMGSSLKIQTGRRRMVRPMDEDGNFVSESMGGGISPTGSPASSTFTRDTLQRFQH